MLDLDEALKQNPTQHTARSVVACQGTRTRTVATVRRNDTLSAVVNDPGGRGHLGSRPWVCLEGVRFQFRLRGSPS